MTRLIIGNSGFLGSKIARLGNINGVNSLSTLAEVEGHISIAHEYIIDVGVVDSNADEINNSENIVPEEITHSENDLNQTTDAEIINSESKVSGKSAHSAEPLTKSQTLISKSSRNSTKK